VKRSMMLPILFALWFVLVLAVACGNAGAATSTSQTSVPPPTVTTRPTTHEPVEGQIHVYSVHNEPSLIQFSGTAGLPNGTILRSQLYADSTPVPWWPAGHDISVQNGQWTISVALGDGGSSREILVGPFYSINVWERDNPARHGGFSFDLVGPPAVNG